MGKPKARKNQVGGHLGGIHCAQRRKEEKHNNGLRIHVESPSKSDLGKAFNRPDQSSQVRYLGHKPRDIPSKNSEDSSPNDDAFGSRSKTGRIKRNPLKDATGVRDKTNLPDVPRTLVGQVLTIEELFRLAKETGYYEDVVLVLGLCGLRWGELVGLRVQDLSLLDGTLTVRRSILSINGKLEESTTKSKRERSIRLPKVLHDRAHNWVLGKESSDPLFHTPQKALLRGTNFKKRVFAPALQRLQLPHMRLHDLRHVAATIGISAGATPNMVKDMLGHSDVQLTMRVYSHIFDTDREKVADNLNRAINDVQKMCIIDVSEERAKEGDGPFPAQKQGFSEPNPNGFDARPTDYEFRALTN